jgi:sugar lactone lactonase YvrE
MMVSARLPLALILACGTFSLAAQAQTIVTLGAGFTNPSSVAVDGNGNVFVADQNANTVSEVTASGAYVTATTLGSGFDLPEGVAVDASGNVFVADTFNNAVKEIVAAGGYTTVTTVGSGFSFPQGVAVDATGNVYVADSGNHAVKKILAFGAYTTVITVGTGFANPAAVAVDASNNVFVADQGNNEVDEIPSGGSVVSLGNGFDSPEGIALDKNGNLYVALEGSNEVDEILAAGGYVTVNRLGTGFNGPEGVAVDAAGDVFVADTANKVIKEILTAAPALEASVLPDSRSVQVGSPATIFATLINTGTSPLDNCRIALPAVAPAGLSLSYQTTDPATNALTGTANTPVNIAGSNGSQSFLIALQGTSPVTAPEMPLTFACSDAPPAPSFIGVNTVDLTFSSTPTADIVALSATATNNGTLLVPTGKAGAFAVATINLGAAAQITASVDTGTTDLPITLTICETNPSTAQCLAAPAGSVSLNFAANATPTFSVFVQANGPIALAPASARIFVRFEDASKGLHGSTSVAVESD